jgi:hypothetical protein
MKPTHKKKRARARNPVTREPITDTVEVMEIEVVSGPDDPLQADELELSEDSVLLEDEE